MKTFVIAQHHGVFLTLQSLIDQGINDIVVIIPDSQVNKYNKMYEDNVSREEFKIFKDFDKRVKTFIDANDKTIELFIVDDFDISNTVTSILRIINTLEFKGKVACLMAGTVVLKDYREAVNSVATKPFNFCMSRVYQEDRHLSMYHMIGLPKVDKSVDVNFFVVDIDSMTENDFVSKDVQLLNNANATKRMNYISREFNAKDDPLLGNAISARQTVVHNLRSQSSYILNLWNKVIVQYDRQKSEEFFAYPYEYYGKYAEAVKDNLPVTTVHRIVKNGNESKKWVGGLVECIDIIDLINT